MWDQILRALQKKKEEEAALAAEPSLMDEWIEKNDPAQYKKIQEAKIALEIPSLAMGTINVSPKPSLTSVPRVSAAKEALSDIAGTSGFAKYGEGLKRFKESQKNWPSYDKEELAGFIEKATPQELEQLLGEEYSGGIEQFLQDYRKEYAPQAYLDYVRSFHSAKDPKMKEKIKGFMDSIKAEGIHINK